MRKAVSQAIEQGDKGYLQELARKQAEAGANAIDVNSDAAGNEVETMKWLVDIVQEVTDVPLCFDSPNALAIETGLGRCKQQAIVNSITAEAQRWGEILPLIQQYKAKVVAICMNDQGLPEGSRISVADKLINNLVNARVQEDDIYLDPLVKRLGVN